MNNDINVTMKQITIKSIKKYKILGLIIIMLSISLTFTWIAFAALYNTNLGSFNGVTIFSNGTALNASYQDSLTNGSTGSYLGMKWQCVEYVRRYYYQIYNVNLAPLHKGNANTFWDPNSAAKMGLDRFSNGGSTAPQMGDMIVSAPGGTCKTCPAGHIAIIRGISGNQVHVAQQNYTETTQDMDYILTLTVSNGNYTVAPFGSGYPVAGWLRRQGTTAPPPCQAGSSEGFRPNSSFPVHPNGTLIKLASDPTFYLIRNGQKQGIVSYAALEYLYDNGGFKFEDVITVAQDEFNSYPTAPNAITATLPSNGKPDADGTLIRKSNGEISIITDNGGRRPFTSLLTFNNLGYKTCNITDVSDNEYNLYPVGSPVTGLPSTSNNCPIATGQGTSGSELTAFQNAYNTGGGQSVLGCATSNVGTGFTSFPGTTSHYQRTANGDIEYHTNGSRAGQAFAVPTSFYNKWSSYGFTTNGNFLGYPTSIVSPQAASCQNTLHQYQSYEGGSLVQHQGGGRNNLVYEVHGLIHYRWQLSGFAGCPLGLPLSDESPAQPSGATGRQGLLNEFEGGQIYYRYGDSEAYEVHGSIKLKYVSLAGSAGWLGFPTSNEFVSSGRARSNFEAGYITTLDGVNYQAFPYNQCSYSISSTSVSLGSNGGNGTVNVTTSSGCSWTTGNNSPWITITSGISGSGNGTVSFSAASNSGQARTGTITIAGQTFTVTQSGAATGGCPSPSAITVGQTINGTLQSGDCLRNGKLYDAYTFNGTAQQKINLRLNSTQFDTYLYLYRGNYPNGTLWSSNDDGGGGTNSRIPATSGYITLPTTGTYTILASSYATGESGSYTLSSDRGVSIIKLNTTNSYDFDSDGKTDYSIFRPLNGVWYSQMSTNGFDSTQFGISTDKIVAADYDGDSRTDTAVFRDGIWYLLQSTDGFTSVQFGVASDIPMPADYDGDGKADIAVFRPSNGTWYLLRSSQGFTGVQFGQNGDKPVAADYDGDGKTDIAVVRQENGVSNWYIFGSDRGFYGIQFGSNTDRLAPADYDGDGKTDIAVYRNGTWYLSRSRDGFTAIQFGTAEDKLVAGDYDGDGKADVAVWRPSNGTFYVLQSQDGFVGTQFGQSGDSPVVSAFVP